MNLIDLMRPRSRKPRERHDERTSVWLRIRNGLWARIYSDKFIIAERIYTDDKNFKWVKYTISPRVKTAKLTEEFDSLQELKDSVSSRPLGLFEK